MRAGGSREWVLNQYEGEERILMEGLSSHSWAHIYYKLLLIRDCCSLCGNHLQCSIDMPCLWFFSLLWFLGMMTYKNYLSLYSKCAIFLKTQKIVVCTTMILIVVWRFFPAFASVYWSPHPPTHLKKLFPDSFPTSAFSLSPTHTHTHDMPGIDNRFFMDCYCPLCMNLI